MDNVEIVKTLTEHEVRLDNLEHEQQSMKSTVMDIHNIASAMQVMSVDMGYIKTDVAEVKSNQKDLNAWKDNIRGKFDDLEHQADKKKAKFLDNIGEKVAWLVVGGIVAFLLSQLLPNIF